MSPHQNGPHNAEAQGHVDFQPAWLFGSLVQFILREQEEAEILQAHAVEGHFIGFVVLAEAAGTTSAGRQEDVVVEGLLLAILSHLGLQEIHQAARGKDRGAARAGVDQFLAGVEVRARDIGQGLGLVIQIVENPLDQPLMFPGQATEQNRRIVPLFSGERPRFVGSVVSHLSSCGCHAYPPCSLRLYLDSRKALLPCFCVDVVWFAFAAWRKYGIENRAGFCPWVDTNPRFAPLGTSVKLMTQSP